MKDINTQEKSKSEEMIKLSIHNNAKDLIVDTTDKYSVSLIYDSKVIAFKKGSDEVQSNHVKEALINMDQKKKKNWKSEILKIVGGSFFGVFIPGFITSLNPVNSTSLVISELV